MVRCQAFTGLPQLTTRVLNGTIQFRRMFHWSAAPTFSSSAQGMRSTAGASLLVVVAGAHFFRLGVDVPGRPARQPGMTMRLCVGHIAGALPPSHSSKSHLPLSHFGARQPAPLPHTHAACPRKARKNAASAPTAPPPPSQAACVWCRVLSPRRKSSAFGSLGQSEATKASEKGDHFTTTVWQGRMVSNHRIPATARWHSNAPLRTTIFAGALSRSLRRTPWHIALRPAG